jgi:hypothetical protein
MFLFQKAFLFLLLAGCALMSTINSQPNYNHHFCRDQSNETLNTSFESSLTVLLGSLSSKASENNNFYNDSSNGIYGLFLCRGDVNTSTCQSCVSSAGQEIRSQCSSNRTAIIWYDECMLRYSDTNFFGVEDTSLMVFMWNVHNSSVSPTETDFGQGAQMDDLISKALASDKLFNASSRPADSGSDVRYGLVQCTRDIDSTSCNNCFGILMTEANRCCEAKKGWRVLSPSCNIRYENYSFFQQVPPTPPTPQPVPVAPQPPPDNGKTSSTFPASICIIWTYENVHLGQFVDRSMTL